MAQPLGETCISDSKDDGRIVFLDYLRVFAFATVLIGHKFYDALLEFSQADASPEPLRLGARLLLPLVHGGGVGVLVFFLVSGYIIMHVLRTEKPGEFIWRRAFRIYPLYVFAVLMQYFILMARESAPPLSVLIPQLLLIGDLFGTPYALRGVEWTLRVELVFYLYIASLHCLRPSEHRDKVFFGLFVVTVLVLGWLPALPDANEWRRGYLSIYAPMLLLGAVVYLVEQKAIKWPAGVLFAGLVLYQSYRLTISYQPRWLDAHFSLLALFVFGLLWGCRHRLATAPLILFLSELTYAIYLFHNWVFDYIRHVLRRFEVPVIHPDWLVLAVLLVLSYAAARYIEKPGIRLGRRLLKIWQSSR